MDKEDWKYTENMGNGGPEVRSVGPGFEFWRRVYKASC